MYRLKSQPTSLPVGGPPPPNIIPPPIWNIMFIALGSRAMGFALDCAL
jgi:hypothetical protein